jgi:signal peptidase I
MKIEATRSQWTKFIVVTLLYLAFLLWVKSWWGLIVVPFIFDAYISKIIPWSFWKKSKDATVRTVMSWVDAIVFALVAVYFVNIYFFQNYQIPSSSLEKSLLVGDFLYVSKMSYGPRVPNTPLSLPLTQHTIPGLNVKSYLDWPQWKYRRVKGFGGVKRGDIVVFNFPAGDTVSTVFQQNDFFANMAYATGEQIYQGKLDMDSLTREQQYIVYNLYYKAGSDYIHKHPELYGDIIYRPVDRRENYVKRCIATPGDTLQIINKEIFINGEKQKDPEDIQFFYKVYGTGTPLPYSFLHDELGLSLEDTQGYEAGAMVFALPLTKAALAKLTARKDLVSSVEPIPIEPAHDLYPQNLYTDWTVDNYGPIWIPAKGATIDLNIENLPFYERCIVNYEGNTLDVRDGEIFINGVKADTYTFKMDYYWMMGDNRHNSQDSRYWGFVPEDHVVGKPLLVWLSLDKDRGWFNGKIRWNRLFKWVG